MRKPTYASRRGAVEAGVVWRKSSYSFPEGECVEVARPAEVTVLFCDSKACDGAVVEVSASVALLFLTALGQGRV